MTTLPDQLRALQSRLAADFPGVMLMPACNDGKHPMHKHSKGQYSAQEFSIRGAHECDQGCLIILPHALIVVDVDDEHTSAEMEARFPEFTQTVTCKTRKGHHYYFSRTPTCHLMDGARQAGPEGPPIDIKTATRTGTGGLISIPPSPNKRWLRPVGDAPILPIPQAFVDYFTQLCASKSLSTRPATRPLTTAPLGQDGRTSMRSVPQLVSMLSPHRADSYDLWLHLGMCLHNIAWEVCRLEDAFDEAASLIFDEHLSLWIDFSKQRVDKFKEGECEAKWDTFADPADLASPLSIASLHLWARTDSPTKYRQLSNEHTAEQWLHAALAILGTTHLDPAGLRSVFNTQVHDHRAISMDIDHVQGPASLHLDNALRVTLTTPAETCTTFMHEKEPIVWSGSFDLGSLHKDFPVSHEWMVTRNTNTAVVSAKDYPARVELLNMDVPHGVPSARIMFTNRSVAQIRDKTVMNSLLAAYNETTTHALRTQWGMGWMVQQNNIQINNTTITSDADSVINQEDIIQSLLQLEPTLRERFVCNADPTDTHVNNMYHCDPETNIWDPVTNGFVERTIKDLVIKHAPALKLDGKELRTCVSRSGRSDLRVVLSQELMDRTFVSRLNKNLYLFPCKNGVFDMKGPGRPTFRPLTPEDMVSKTCGWSYDPEQARIRRPAVERFLEQMLPIPDERIAALVYLAALMCGVRIIKRFLVLTDKRIGDNGKSTFATFIFKFFGKKLANYLGQKLVTRPAVERGGRNDHDGGIQAFEGVRLVIAEELKKNMLFDEGFLKKVTGGDEVVITGRKFAEASQFDYIWTAGIMLVINEGDFPQADPSDGAFWSRVMVVPFRSKFVPDVEGCTEPYTYPVVGDIKGNFEDWLPALADILLDVYDPMGRVLFNLPASMRDWKDTIESDANPVSEWTKSKVQLIAPDPSDKKRKEIRTPLDKSLVTSLMQEYIQQTKMNTNFKAFLANLKAYFTSVGRYRSSENICQPNGTWKSCKNVVIDVIFLED